MKINSNCSEIIDLVVNKEKSEFENMYSSKQTVPINDLFQTTQKLLCFRIRVIFFSQQIQLMRQYHLSTMIYNNSHMCKYGWIEIKYQKSQMYDICNNKVISYSAYAAVFNSILFFITALDRRQLMYAHALM